MAKKTYKTYSLKGLALHLLNEYGRPIEVNFRAGAQIDSTAKFTTSDEAVQEAIEACSGFNRDYYLESVCEDKPAAAPEPAPKAEEVAEEKSAPAAEEPAEVSDDDGLQKVPVADKSDAVEWLKEHHPEEGYSGVKLRTMAQVNAAAKKHGVVFVIKEQ